MTAKKHPNPTPLSLSLSFFTSTLTAHIILKKYIDSIKRTLLDVFLLLFIMSIIIISFCLFQFHFPLLFFEFDSFNIPSFCIVFIHSYYYYSSSIIYSYSNSHHITQFTVFIHLQSKYYFLSVYSMHILHTFSLFLYCLIEFLRASKLQPIFFATIKFMPVL